MHSIYITLAHILLLSPYLPINNLFVSMETFNIRMGSMRNWNASEILTSCGDGFKNTKRFTEAETGGEGVSLLSINFIPHCLHVHCVLSKHKQIILIIMRFHSFILSWCAAMLVIKWNTTQALVKSDMILLFWPHFLWGGTHASRCLCCMCHINWLASVYSMNVPVCSSLKPCSCSMLTG